MHGESADHIGLHPIVPASSFAQAEAVLAMFTQLASREPNPGHERRRYQRHALRCQCWVEGEELTLYGSTIDIGVGGLFLRTAVPLAKGSFVDLTLKMDSEDAALAARALVARAVPVKNGVRHGIGLEFVEVHRGQHALASLLSRSASLPWL